MRRRDFLAHSAVTPLLGSQLASVQLAGKPAAKRRAKYLFLDNKNLELGTGWHFGREAGLKRSQQVDSQGMIYDGLYGPCARVKRVMHQPVRYGDFPLIKGDKPWEGALCYFGGHYLNPDPDTGKFRMYYQCWTQEPDAVEHCKWCMAVSDDGLRWAKPELGAVEWRGSKKNNIVLDGPGVGHIWGGVMYDEDETDPHKKWKALCDGSVGNWYGVCVYFSPDGIHWTPYRNNPVLTGRVEVGDTYALFGKDKSLNQYVAYLRPQDWFYHYPDRPFHRLTEGGWPFGAGGKLNHPFRTIGRSTSQDFIHWTVPEEVLAPDLEDPIGTQFYGMTVDKYEDYYIGNLWVYHTDSSDDTIRIELATSADGIKWNRSAQRTPFIDIADEGPYHSYMILGTTSPFLVMGDEIWIYYSAFNCSHYGTVFPKRLAGIGLCKLRLDGFMSIAAEGEEGYFLSKPFDWQGEELELEINADASKGYLTVELIGNDHLPIPGYSHQECLPLTKNEIHQQVRWKNQANLKAVGDRQAYFLFRLKDAEIFSFSLQESL